MNLKIALLLMLFTTFVAIIAWVFRPNSKQHYKNIASIPLRDDKGSYDEK